MNFEVYCDESGLEALSDKEAHRFAGIGGIWLPAEYRDVLKDALNKVKDKYKIYGEFKWQKISPRYIDFYKELLDYFFQTEQLRFRIVLIEAQKVDHIGFNNKDSELGFYKFYYQLLHHWIFDFNQYSIFVDFKVNRNKSRLKELRKVLENANLTSNINQVQGLPSEQSLGIQLADFLTGLVSAKFNEEISGKAKIELIDYAENKYLGRPITSTSKWEEKFNVFRMNLKGGW